jgi:hypothetical protein
MTRQRLLPPLLLLLGVFFPARALPPNLLPNSGFEDGMTGWTTSVADPGQAGAAAALDPGALAGRAALKLTLPGKGSCTVTSSPAPVEPGRDYLVAVRYRSTGFSKPGKYDIGAGGLLTWADAAGKSLGTAPFGGISFTAQAEWSCAVRLVTVPADAATVRLTLTLASSEGSTPSALWLDQAQVRRWDPPAQPTGTTTVYRVCDGYFNGATCRVVADDATANGLAVVANPKYVQKPGYLSCALYLRELKPGTYRVVYRLKAEGLPTATVPVVHLVSEYERGGAPNSRLISSGEFAQPGAYQEFVLRVIKTPWNGFIGLGAAWQANAAVWADTITVIEEETYSREQMDALCN